jgi:hypothetical protein
MNGCGRSPQRRRPLARTLGDEDIVHLGFMGPNGPSMLLGSIVYMYNQM